MIGGRYPFDARGFFVACVASEARRPEAHDRARGVAWSVCRCFVTNSSHDRMTCDAFRVEAEKRSPARGINRRGPRTVNPSTKTKGYPAADPSEERASRTSVSLYLQHKHYGFVSRGAPRRRSHNDPGVRISPVGAIRPRYLSPLDRLPSRPRSQPPSSICPSSHVPNWSGHR